MELYEYLTAKKSDIKKRVCNTADISGKHCWLWLPEKRCKNKRICLVAHIDIVHNEDRKKRVFHDTNNAVMWSPDGLGADDRAGVFACMDLRMKTGCMVLLTDLEEHGGIGAMESVDTFKKEFKSVDFFVELDRRGDKDMVFYNGESIEFKNYIKKFGFKEERGSFSDISTICRNTKIVGVNLSIGYYHEHSDREYLKINQMNKTIIRVTHMINSGEKYDTSKWSIRSYSMSFDAYWEDYMRMKYSDDDAPTTAYNSYGRKLLREYEVPDGFFDEEDEMENLREEDAQELLDRVDRENHHWFY